MTSVAEITRDNNGSLSDSSFDVESEENFDRRRAHASHSPTPGASRLANSPHQHRRSAAAGGGRPSARHAPPPSGHGARHQPPPPPQDARRHHRAASDPDSTLDRRSTATPGAGPGDYRTTSRAHGGKLTGGGGGGGKAAAATDTYGQQQSRLFVALFDYDPQTMSPNQNAINDELPFTEGQIIKVRAGAGP